MDSVSPVNYQHTFTAQHGHKTEICMEKVPSGEISGQNQNMRLCSRLHSKLLWTLQPVQFLNLPSAQAWFVDQIEIIEPLTEWKGNQRKLGQQNRL